MFLKRIRCKQVVKEKDQTDLPSAFPSVTEQQDAAEYFEKILRLTSPTASGVRILYCRYNIVEKWEAKCGEKPLNQPSFVLSDLPRRADAQNQMLMLCYRDSHWWGILASPHYFGGFWLWTLQCGMDLATCKLGNWSILCFQTSMSEQYLWRVTVKGRPKNKGENMNDFPESNLIKESLCFCFFLIWEELKWHYSTAD